MNSALNQLPEQSQLLLTQVSSNVAGVFSHSMNNQIIGPICNSCISIYPQAGAMHPCSGGPLAMATPLHTFPGHTSAPRLELEDSTHSPLPPMSSHLLSPPTQEAHHQVCESIYSVKVKFIFTCL